MVYRIIGGFILFCFILRGKSKPKTKAELFAEIAIEKEELAGFKSPVEKAKELAELYSGRAIYVRKSGL